MSYIFIQFVAKGRIFVEYEGWATLLVYITFNTGQPWQKKNAFKLSSVLKWRLCNRLDFEL